MNSAKQRLIELIRKAFIFRDGGNSHVFGCKGRVASLRSTALLRGNLNNTIKLATKSTATSSLIKGCNSAAGNCIIVGENGSNDISKSSLEEDVRLEILLMETHGCSPSHHLRQKQMDNGELEVEF